MEELTEDLHYYMQQQKYNTRLFEGMERK